MVYKGYYWFKNLLLFTLLVFAFSFLSYKFTSATILPGEKCNVNPLPNWTSQERWVWKQVCEGKIADFNKAEGVSLPIDPRKSEGWHKERILSQSFLETILLHEPYRGTIGRNGVFIIGAWFREPINLLNATISHPLALVKSRFDRDVIFMDLKTPFSISLEGSKFNGNVNMDKLVTDGSLFLKNMAEFSKDLILRSAKIGSQLVMNNSKFYGDVNMNGLQVADILFMHKATFDFAGINKDGRVDLRGAKIGDKLEMDGAKFNVELMMDGLKTGSALFMRGGAKFAKGVRLNSAIISSELDMIGSKFREKLNMNNIKVGSDLFMNTKNQSEKTEFAEITLIGAKIGGQLNMRGSKFNQNVYIDSIQLDGNFFLNEAIFEKPVGIFVSEIGGNIDISDSTFSNLYLSGTTVKG